MADTLQFETPENVQVKYAIAGTGTRFLAWFIDQLFVVGVVIALAVLLACAGVSFESVFRRLDPDTIDPHTVGLYFMGILFLVMGLGSFVYFTASELFLRGQTIGKRAMKIRVVKTDGFALDPGSILIRNLFRVLDNLPLMWVIPLLSQRAQRAGDMVGGTVVISDAQPELSDVRTRLSERTAAEAEFRFDSRTLSRLNADNFEAVERLLDRWDSIPNSQQDLLLSRLVGPLATKMQVEAPPEARRLRFLEDLLAAELRRQNRLLN